VVAGSVGGRPADSELVAVPWIRWVDEREADDRLRALYRRCGGPDGIDHILKIHSLNPASLEAHYELYRHLMHGPSGLSRAEREMIAVVVSSANGCFY